MTQRDGGDDEVVFATFTKPSGRLILGDDVSDVTARRETIDRLSHLVDKFSQFGFPIRPGATAKVDKASATAAKQFLRALPDSAQLPKIAPEGDGGVLFMWEQGAPNADSALIIDGFTMHTICGLGLPDAAYADDIPFDGVEIPATVLAIIPPADAGLTVTRKEE